MRRLLLIPLLLLALPAAAEDELSWEVKKAALMQAYRANGNSMSGYGTFDASDSIAVTTERVAPIAEAADKNELDEQADLNMADLRKFSRRANYKTDICARHGLRKTKTNRGQSWRCKR